MSSSSNTSSYGTFASASSTFMWPGMRPATGWMAYFTSTPSFLSRSAISRSACCACATAMPYPGTMITFPAFLSMKAASSAEPCFTRRRAGDFAAETAEDHRDEAAIHSLAHDVGQDRARGADQRASDDERGIAQREADARRRPAGIGIEH